MVLIRKNEAKLRLCHEMLMRCCVAKRDSWNVGPCAKHFAFMNAFNPHHSVRQVLALSPTYRWKNEARRRNDLLQLKLVCSRPMMLTIKWGQFLLA